MNYWATQGVLLLNTSLTVKQGLANSHKNIGWNIFTDNIISIISAELDHVVFLLWGGNAKTKVRLINQNKHTVLQSSHPSPLSAYRGFLQCKHFSLTNKALIKNKQQPIDWSIPD